MLVNYSSTLQRAAIVVDPWLPIANLFSLAAAHYADYRPWKSPPVEAFSKAAREPFSSLFANSADYVEAMEAAARTNKPSDEKAPMGPNIRNLPLAVLSADAARIWTYESTPTLNKTEDLGARLGATLHAWGPGSVRETWLFQSATVPQRLMMTNVARDAFAYTIPDPTSQMAIDVSGQALKLDSPKHGPDIARALVAQREGTGDLAQAEAYGRQKTTTFALSWLYANIASLYEAAFRWTPFMQYADEVKNYSLIMGRDLEYYDSILSDLEPLLHQLWRFALLTYRASKVSTPIGDGPAMLIHTFDEAVFEKSAETGSSPFVVRALHAAMKHMGKPIANGRIGIFEWLENQRPYLPILRDHGPRLARLLWSSPAGGQLHFKFNEPPIVWTDGVYANEDPVGVIFGTRELVPLHSRATRFSPSLERYDMGALTSCLIEREPSPAEDANPWRGLPRSVIPYASSMGEPDSHPYAQSDLEATLDLMGLRSRMAALTSPWGPWPDGHLASPLPSDVRGRSEQLSGAFSVWDSDPNGSALPKNAASTDVTYFLKREAGFAERVVLSTGHPTVYSAVHENCIVPDRFSAVWLRHTPDMPKLNVPFADSCLRTVKAAVGL